MAILIHSVCEGYIIPSLADSPSRCINSLYFLLCQACFTQKGPGDSKLSQFDPSCLRPPCAFASYPSFWVPVVAQQLDLRKRHRPGL
jgi:hypothetical protein